MSVKTYVRDLIMSDNVLQIQKKLNVHRKDQQILKLADKLRVIVEVQATMPISSSYEYCSPVVNFKHKIERTV